MLTCRTQFEGWQFVPSGRPHAPSFSSNHTRFSFVHVSVSLSVRSSLLFAILSPEVVLSFILLVLPHPEAPVIAQTIFVVERVPCFFVFTQVCTKPTDGQRLTITSQRSDVSDTNVSSSSCLDAARYL